MWKEALNIPLYEVSNYGRVRSWRHHKVKTTKEPLLIKPYTNKRGYCQVSIMKGGKRYYTRVHRLVLEAFIGSCPDKMEACHNNGVRNDNRLINLRWDTRKNNHADKKSHGTWQGGENNGSSRLKESDVNEIRRLQSLNTSPKEISHKFNITEATVSHILLRKTWKHLA